ncbi:claudin-12 [Podarcis lilfordi]|uniref:Claudin-12 n=1 Tax=Podarcis lilfordi TaxID=74358 RepID=A0AA35PH48_9SAUR|nr:claudin-12 [Podarcis lilfordi]
MSCHGIWLLFCCFRFEFPGQTHSPSSVGRGSIRIVLLLARVLLLFWIWLNLLEAFLLAKMGCRDVHAATVLAFLSGTAALSGLIAAALLPNWRQMRLFTYNKNEKNVTVYTGLWIKCVRFDGSKDCVIYDTEWYTAVDQLDLRVLQFALPISMLTTVLALFLCLIGMCNTAFITTVPNIKQARCLINSAGCHLVAGLFFLLACVICLTPSIWVIFHNQELNKKYEPVFSFDISVFIAIASAGGLLFTAILLFLWYCACKTLPSPFWQPLYPHAPSVHTGEAKYLLVLSFAKALQRLYIHLLVLLKIL